MPADNRTITVTRTVARNDGECVFDEATVVLNAGDPDDPPLAKSPVQPATAISFRWTPGDYTFDFHPAPRRRLIVMLDGKLEVVVGSGERRRFIVGDVLEVADVTGRGHISRAADGRPFRSAFINIDDDLITPRTKPLDGSSVPASVGYLRTVEGPDGRSVTAAGQLPYRHGGASGYVTNEIPITGFQFVLAPPDLDYAWHRAPQMQFVIPITGGMEVENGQGERHKVRPGELYVGEDVGGQGHITRALDGRERLSIFAHLKDSLE